MARRIAASNTTATLHPIAPELTQTTVMLETTSTPETPATPDSAQIVDEPPSTASNTVLLEPCDYSPYYVTRAEWNNLLERILHFNGRSPQRL